MGTLYRDISSKIVTEEFLFANLPKGLAKFEEPDNRALWQRAITDGKNYLWLEVHNGQITHFLRWGVNDVCNIIKLLNRHFSACIVSEHDARF